MKNLSVSLFALFLAVGLVSKAQAISFDDITNQQKPSAILLYADWADNLAPAMASYGALEQAFAKKYNFVKINIGKDEAKSFNKMYYIYPNLPYVLLYKEKGKITRCIAQECLLDNSCIKEKLNAFIN